MANDKAVTDLIAAIDAADQAAVARLLDEQPALAHGWKPINHAAYLGRKAIVATLIDHGADFSAVSTSCFAPLHRAIEPKDAVPRTPAHVETVKLLVERGASLDARGCWHRSTPLLTAAMAGNAEMAAIIGDALFATRPPTIFEASALGMADRIAALLAVDAVLASAPDANGLSALHYCASSQLWRGSNTLAASLVAVAEILIAAGAPVDAKASLEGFALPPLHWGTKNPAVARVLIAHGANPTDALGSAMWEEAWEFAEYLVGAGANVDARDGDRTLLHERLHWGKTKPALWLLAHGADPNLADARGNTPLHSAAGRGLGEPILRALIEADANADAKNSDSLTPADLARAKGKTKAAAFLDSRKPAHTP